MKQMTPFIQQTFLQDSQALRFASRVRGISNGPNRNKQTNKNPCYHGAYISLHTYFYILLLFG